MSSREAGAPHQPLIQLITTARDPTGGQARSKNVENVRVGTQLTLDTDETSFSQANNTDFAQYDPVNRHTGRGCVQASAVAKVDNAPDARICILIARTDTRSFREPG